MAANLRPLEPFVKRHLMTHYPRDIERTMRAFYRSLREHDRRRYAAIEATKLGHGGVEYIAKILEVDTNTIRRGARDLDELPGEVGDGERVREPGGGRKRRIDHDPKIDQDFRKTLVDHTAGSPDEQTLIWTDLTRTTIVDLMQDCGSYVSVHIVDQLLDRHGFHQRKALRMEPMGHHPDRNAQFETIARLKAEYLGSADPVLSMDLKSREGLGNFFRQGRLLTQRTARVFDHDFTELAQGVVLPHGIYDITLNKGYVHLGQSNDTSEFACDCLRDWWARFGRARYAGAKSLLLLCDGGGSNPADTERCQANLFRADLQQLVNDMGIEIRVAHYPPYASKYNPIEHRLFPHLTRVCQGVILRSIDLVAELMRKAKTRTGLTVDVTVLDKTYQLGRKVSEAMKESIHLVRDALLPRWNYRISPSV
jgi:hypothetical protein